MNLPTDLWNIGNLYGEYVLKTKKVKVEILVKWY